MVVESRHTEIHTITDFLGYVGFDSGPPGTITDPGDTLSPYRSRGFQIDHTGALVKSRGYCTVGQVFSPNNDISKIHGMHYWRAPSGGSTVVLCDDNGIYRSRQKSDTPGTDPYMLRFDALTQVGPTWPTQPSAGSGLYLFGNFAEFQDRLYYCNGIDWPIRIDGVYRLFERGGNPSYSAMGVFHPSLAGDSSSAVVMELTVYYGIRGEALGQSGEYAVSIDGKFGESPVQRMDYPVSDPNMYRIMRVDDWTDFPEYVTGIKVYRLPLGGASMQYMATIRRGDDTFLDDVSDGELGYGVPYDVGLPANFRLLCTYQDRLFAVGGFGNHNRLACSKAGYPDVWPALFEINLKSGLGKPEITQMCVIRDALYIFLREGILRIVGSSPENYQVSSVSDFVGCIAPRTLLPWRDGVVFLSKDGVYYFNGQNLSKLAEQLPGILDTTATGMQGWQRACGAVSKDYYYLSYRDDSGRSWRDASNAPEGREEPNRTYAINIVNRRVGVIDDWAFSVSTPMEQNESLVIGQETLA